MRKMVFALFLFGLLAGWGAFALVSSLQAQQLNATRYTKTVQVDVFDNSFSPPDVEVFVGDTVRWENKGFNAHNVIAYGGAFDSGAENSSAWTYEFTPTSAGNYGYFCAPHENQGMIGNIEVKERFLNVLPVIIKPGSGGPTPDPSP